MREIKFRAWDKIEKRMFVPDGIDQSADGAYVIEFERPLHTLNKIVRFCGSVILMQFTGLKDKNGKEIYEGDMVRHDGRIPLDEEVTFDGAAFYPVYSAPSQHWEVIGNIYENPELLK